MTALHKLASRVYLDMLLHFTISHVLSEKFIGTTVILLTLSTMLSVGLVKCQFQSYEDDRPSLWVRKLVLGYIAKLVFIKKDTHADVVEQREALMVRYRKNNLTVAVNSNCDYATHTEIIMLLL